MARADGTLGAFERQPDMPHGRVSHCALFVSGHLVVMGGIHKPDPNGDFENSDEVHAAPVDAEGNLGPWATVGQAPSSLTECTAVARDGNITVVGSSFADDSHEGGVWQTSLSDSGELGAWQRVGDLPTAFVAFGQHAWWRGSALYTTDFRLPDSGNSTVVLRTDASNAPSDWTVDEWLPEFRGRPLLANDESNVWVVGGYIAGNETVSSVARGPIQDDGSVATAVADRPLPEPRNAGAAVVVDGFLFAMGGRAQLIGELRDDVWVAAITADGLGEWTALGPLPEPRSSFEVTPVGSWLFLTGGGTGSAGEPTVMRTTVRF